MSSPFCRFDKHRGKDGDPLISSQHKCNDSKNKELTGSRHFQFPFALCLVILCSHTLSSPTLAFMGLLKLVPQITKRSFRDIPYFGVFVDSIRTFTWTHSYATYRCCRARLCSPLPSWRPEPYGVGIPIDVGLNEIYSETFSENPKVSHGFRGLGPKGSMLFACWSPTEQRFHLSSHPIALVRRFFYLLGY